MKENSYRQNYLKKLRVCECECFNFFFCEKYVFYMIHFSIKNKGDGIDVYIDGCRFLPDNTTITKLAIQLLWTKDNNIVKKSRYVLCFLIFFNEIIFCSPTHAATAKMRTQNRR